ncbi:MAG: TonB-dependent receptor, partial [Acidobacteriaceae bacterium]|nr:TonB-dependent receptor [Acidobacteriaceae bacterium]
RLPPKESIREIRINSNPFSAEFDKLGYGRIQIFTTPGSDKFHGQGYYNISDDIWNARNPFSFPAPPFRTQLFGGNLSGPLGKHASFFIDAERRNIDDNGVLDATIPTANFLGTALDQTYAKTPQRRTTVSPRVDYQLGANNTLSFRYSFLENNRQPAGFSTYDLPQTTIGNMTFPSTGYNYASTEHTVQIVETAVLSAKTINETHFQFDHTDLTRTSLSSAPELDVAQSFVTGGSGFSAPGFSSSYDLQNYYELQNYTSVTWGAHVTKFGIRTRTTVLDDRTPQDFNGEYVFQGGTFPLLNANLQEVPGQSVRLQSIQQYLLTEQLFAAGLSSQAISAMGYGPTKYTVSTGNPYIGISQTDIGPFIQDDWRILPNLTLSFGLRWEWQTNISDHSDWAPRFGFAWSPDAKRSSGRAKTVIRGGWGIFYDRFGLANVETAYRYLESNPLKTYTLNAAQLAPYSYNAAFSHAINLTSNATANLTPTNASQIFQIDRNLRSPRLMQTAVGVERQLFGHTTLALNFMNSRGVHELLTDDINAPYASPGSLPPALQGSNLRPFASIFPGDIYDYQSTGIFKQTMVMVNVNTTVGRWLTLFTRYSYGNAHSDTDGLGSMPADPYDIAADWGRSVLDMEHNFFLGGSISGPWGLRFSPFLIAHSGIPFNVTTGTDLYLTGAVNPTARPAVTSDAATIYGVPVAGEYNPQPLVPAPGTSDMIERNAGIGPNYFGLNLRVSKTWGFGTTKFKGPSGGARAGGGGGPRGGGGGGFGGFGGGPRGAFGGESTEHRYNVTLSVNARNILNHTNYNSPVGVITSPGFLYPNNITGGYTAENTSSENRRIDLQLRFTF